jgi:hypothetical protein
LYIQGHITLGLDDSATGSTLSGDNQNPGGTIDITQGATLRIGTGTSPQPATWSAGSIATGDGTGMMEVVHGTLTCTATNLNDSNMPALTVDPGGTFTVASSSDEFCPVTFTNDEGGTVNIDASTILYVGTEDVGAADNEWPNAVTNTGAININPGSSKPETFYCSFQSSGDVSEIDVLSGNPGFYGTAKDVYLGGTAQFSAQFNDSSTLYLTAGTTSTLEEYGMSFSAGSQLRELNTSSQSTAFMRTKNNAVDLVFNGSSLRMDYNAAAGYGDIDCTTMASVVNVDFQAGSTYYCQFGGGGTAPADNEFLCDMWTNHTGTTLYLEGTQNKDWTYSNIVKTSGAANSYRSGFSTYEVNGVASPPHWSFPPNTTTGPQDASYSG